MLRLNVFSIFTIKTTQALAALFPLSLFVKTLTITKKNYNKNIGVVHIDKMSRLIN